jgi:hypothetical protein
VAPHRTQPAGATSWSGGRVALLVVGAVLAVSSLGLLGAGGAALWADQTQRDADGHLTTGTTTLSTSTSALVAEPLDVTLDRPGDAFWLREWLGTVQVGAQAPAGRELFVGLARSDDVDRYLRGVAFDRVTGVTGSDDVTYERRSGAAEPARPGDQAFWVAEASGRGALELDWAVEGGRWTVVVMNADAGTGVEGDVRVGATLPALTGIAVGLLAAGAVVLAGGTVLLVVAAVGARPSPPSGPPVPTPRGPVTSAPDPRTPEDLGPWSPRQDRPTIRP